jgi:hypothetical protein
VDTLDDSKYANMKELRFNAADGVWRVAFAFDTKRKAILRSQERSPAVAKPALTANSSAKRI